MKRSRNRDALRAALKQLEACANHEDERTRRALARAGRRYLLRGLGLEGPASR